jgi:hypothetical protein
MMRISPLGIFGTNYDLQQVAEWARQDAVLTHPNPVCLQANALFAMATAHTISTSCGIQELYRQIETWAREMNAEVALLESITGASVAPPSDYLRQQGWVLIAFRNALWQLLHPRNLEDGVVDTVMRGGDTDTNAAITHWTGTASHVAYRGISQVIHAEPDSTALVHKVEYEPKDPSTTDDIFEAVGTHYFGYFTDESSWETPIKMAVWGLMAALPRLLARIEALDRNPDLLFEKQEILHSKLEALKLAGKNESSD